MLNSRLLSLSLLVGLVGLAGCSSVKKSLGLEREAPDEFAVTPSTLPLDMPPDFFTLPVPDPGAPRPQDVKENQEKKQKLIGSSSSKAQRTSGQTALLELAGAEEGQDQVRREIDRESRIESVKGKPVLEELGIKKSKPRGDALNPYEEAYRLQERGVTQRPLNAAE